MLDRNGGAQPFDGVDIRAFHLVEELAGIRRQRFHVAPLPLGVNRIEGQRRFSGAAKPGNDSQAVARDLNIDILQIVLAGAMHRNTSEHELGKVIML